jgi:hypothetical protein
MELLVELLIESLDVILIGSNRDAWAAVHHEFCCDLSLVLPYILLPKDIKLANRIRQEDFLPEQELAIQVCHINLVQVDHVDVLEAT